MQCEDAVTGRLTTNENEHYKPVGLLNCLASHTCRLLGYDAQNRMSGKAASGFLWHRGDKLHLLTVAHTFRGGNHDLRIDVGLHANGVGMLIEVPEPGWLRVGTLSDAVEVRSANDILALARDVDFAWATYDTDALLAKLRAGAKRQGIKGDLKVVRHDLNVGVSDRTKYNFSALVPTNLHPPTGTFDWREVVEVGMAYDGVQTGGDWDGTYRFRLNRSHVGDAHYHGSSGAPIADDGGNPVALVATGDERTNMIYGCPLQPFVRYVDFPG
jgi:hypothetical protein